MASVNEIRDRALAAVDSASSTDELTEIERAYLGKSGEIMLLMREIGNVPPQERPAFGQSINEARAKVQESVDAKRETLKSGEHAQQFAKEAIDVTLPGLPPTLGIKHPLQQTVTQIKQVLTQLGFNYHDSPDLEQVRYNFEALNYPPDHPAMDEQDTFYVDDQYLLRTQSTALQGRIFEKQSPPIRIFTIGRCYRNEAVDRTHHHTFHQVDCFIVDEGITMAHLKGTLRRFASAMFGGEAKVRFRPDFFPFVEPGVDYAISTPKLFDGKWVELGGAGMIHPNILERYGIDTERYTGFAFGLGVERIPMMKYGVPDLRYFLENDLRFLSQFK